jgi:hypothetical protein
MPASYLTAPVPVPKRGRRSEGRRCPTCRRVLLPTRAGLWPWHFADPDTRRWCKRSDKEMA